MGTVASEKDSGAATPTRPTLAAVAALAGVSPSTASLAFSGAGPVAESTREKVLAAAAALDYAGPDPRAQSLRRGRSGIIGVVIEDRLNEAFRDPMNVAMLDGIADELGTAGVGLLLLTETRGGATNIAVAPMDAVILVGCSTRLDASVVTLHQRGIPIVAIEAEHMEDVVPIDLDNREASRAAAQLLRDLGHTDVAIVTLPIDAEHARGPLTAARVAASSAYTTMQRVFGVWDVFPGARGVASAGSVQEEGAIAGRELLARADRPTAIIAQSDLLAVGVLRAAEELGLRVPEDVSIIGFDGIRLDGLAPHELTTLVQPALEKGRAAGRAVLAAIDGAEPQAAFFESVLRIGTTTAPPRER